MSAESGHIPLRNKKLRRRGGHPQKGFLSRRLFSKRYRAETPATAFRIGPKRDAVMETVGFPPKMKIHRSTGLCTIYNKELIICKNIDMMNIRAFIGTLRTRVAAAALLLLSLASCDSAIYDYEGDCTVSYRIRFRYDMNLKWADAFANEVRSVHLYAFDKEGVLVWKNAERVDRQTAADYSMTLDLPVGSYKLIAWCGLDNGGEWAESFSVPEMKTGTSRQEELTCWLNRFSDETDDAYSDTRLHSLFHGTLDVDLPADEDGGEYTYTMSLTKNTNHIRVILVHLSGEEPDVNKFTFRIEHENGLMAHDNSLLPDESIAYRPWSMQNSFAALGKGEEAEGRASVMQVNGAIADLTVGRMTAEHKDRMILSISNDQGEEVARVPVIHYALLSKAYYEQEYRHTMSDQEFLDREDEYVLTFFLDEDGHWLDTSILIHSWRVVLDNVELN